MSFRERLGSWLNQLQGLDDVPRSGPAYRDGREVDAIGMAVEAVITEARRRPTGDLLVLPNVVTIALPESDLKFWNPLADNLKSQIQRRVMSRAKRAAGKREIVGGEINLKLVQAIGPAEVDVAFSSRLPRSGADIPVTEYLITERVDGRGESSRPKPGASGRLYLQLQSQGQPPAQTPAAAGVQVGRHGDCELRVSPAHTKVSRRAITVQHVTQDKVRVLVQNGNGAWLDDRGKRTRFHTGDTVTLTAGQRLLLDSEAQNALALIDTQGDTRSYT